MEKDRIMAGQNHHWQNQAAPSRAFQQ